MNAKVKPRRPSGMPVAQRARHELAEMADKYGLEGEPDTRKDLQYSHLRFWGLKHLKLFNKSVVQTGRVYIRNRLQEVDAFANLDPSKTTIGVVFHQRDTDPHNAILKADDFFRIMALAEEAMALRALNAKRKGR